MPLRSNRSVSAIALSVLFSAAVPILPKTGHAQAAGQWKDPHEMFTHVCAYCHTTGVGPELRGRHLPPSYIIATVRYGRMGMPAFRPTDFSGADLRSLANMISTSPKRAGISAANASSHERGKP